MKGLSSIAESWRMDRVLRISTPFYACWQTCNLCHKCASSMVRYRIILDVQSEKLQELLKIRRLSLDGCVDVCRPAESAIPHRTVLDDVYEPVYVVNHGRLLKRECRYCGRLHAPKE